MKQRQQSTTSYPMTFLMVDSTDHVTGKTGLSPTVTISKNGGSFGSPSGAVSEIANGWYKIAGNSGDRDTLGEFLIHATASGADPCDERYEVVTFDPFAFTTPTNFSSLSIDGSGRVDVAKVSGTSQTARDLGASVLLSSGTGTGQVDLSSGQVKVQSGTGSGQISLSSGKVLLQDDAISAAVIATDAIDSDAIAASAVTEIQSGLSSLDAAGIRSAVGLASANLDTQLSAIDDYIDTEVAAIKAKTDQLAFTSNRVHADLKAYNGIAITSGSVVTDAGNTQLTFKTDLSETATDHWKDPFIKFTSGSLAGQTHRITGYNGTTKFITVTTAFSATPSNGDTFDIVNN